MVEIATIEWLLKFVMPSAVIGFGAYLAIRVDLARMTERLIATNDRAHEAHKLALAAHDRINAHLIERDK